MSQTMRAVMLRGPRRVTRVLTEPADTGRDDPRFARFAVTDANILTPAK